METEYLLPCSQKPYACSYPIPDEPSPHPSYFRKIHLSIILPSTLFFQLVSSLQAFQLIFCNNFLVSATSSAHLNILGLIIKIRTTRFEITYTEN